MKNYRLAQTAVVGGAGGLFAWVLLQTLTFFQAEIFKLPLLGSFIYEGISVATGIAVFIFSRDAILSRNLFLLKKKIPIGIGVGILSGLLSFAIGQSLLSFAFYLSVAWVKLFSWALLGFWLGVFYNIFERNHQDKLLHILYTIIGSVLGGIFFEACHMLLLDELSNPLGLVILGMILSFSMFFAEIWSAKAYLRVLTGDNEGETYLLDKDKFSMGYFAQNDIVLRGYSEVCEMHAHLLKKDKKYQIFNICDGGRVFVNYRFVDQQEVKNGDIIKVGTALLQFCEVS